MTFVQFLKTVNRSNEDDLVDKDVEVVKVNQNLDQIANANAKLDDFKLFREDKDIIQLDQQK